MAGTPATLVDALAQLPRGKERGFRFIEMDRSEHYYPYEELEAEAQRRAAFLASKGLRKGDRLALVIPEGHEFVLSFLGSVAAGVIPVPIFPKASFKALDKYHDTVSHIVEASGAKYLLTSESTKSFVQPAVSKVGHFEEVWTVEELFSGDTPAQTPVSIEPDDLCFLQFTSGSTSKPKGVMVRHRNLVANATAFLGPHGLNRNDQDVGVSWLPLFHDMGLIGFVLGTLIWDIPVVLLPTATFARGPRIWLETIDKYKGTITYAPNFAYALAAKRVKDRDLESLDLSTLRVAGCGAEPIHAETLRQFSKKLAPTGFRPEAFLPSYGMAEATLAITFHDHQTPIETDVVDAEELQKGRAAPATSDSKQEIELVSCGKSFPGHELAVVDEDGTPLPQRRVGEVVVKGPSITDGYFENPEATDESWKKGFLHTGDLGYLADGSLYICGRAKDLIIIRGANHHPQDIEWLVDSLPGVRRGNVVAFSVLEEGEERLVIVAECNSADADKVREQIPLTIAESVGLQTYKVAAVSVGTIPKTSSGKPQRRRAKQAYERGDLPEHA